MNAIRRNKVMLRLEELESRLAPALLMGPGRVDYIDGDGDRIAIMASKPIFSTDPAFASNILNFTGGSQVDTDINDDLPDTLQRIILTNADSSLLTNLNLTVKLVSKGFGANGAAGNGVDPGIEIDADGFLLGTISVAGDVSQINAGDGTSALKTLTVNSLGKLNSSVLTSTLAGDVGTIKVFGDIQEAAISVQGAVGLLYVGGSLLGTTDAGSASVSASGTIAKVQILGGVVGNDGSNSASIRSTSGRLGSVWIGGSVTGGNGDNSALISSNGAMGEVRILGHLQGGPSATATFSGVVRSESDSIASVHIGGSLIGGAGANDSGEILSPLDIGSVTIKGDVSGGDGLNSGRIHADGNLGDVTVFGSLKGNSISTFTNNGEISSYRDMGKIRISGDVAGGFGQATGVIISAGNLASVVVGKSLLSGGDAYTGGIFAIGNIGAVSIGLNLDGDKGVNNAGTKQIGDHSASIIAGIALDPSTSGVPTGINAGTNASIGTVVIGGSIKGGGNATTVTANGLNAAIISTGALSSIKIAGNLEGGVTGSGTDPAGYIQARRLPSVFIGGSIKTPTNAASGGTAQTNSGAVRAVFDIGSLTVKGNLTGNVLNPVSITAFGEEQPDSIDKAFGDGKISSDTAISSIAVFGNVLYARILAGYQVDPTLASFAVTPQNSEASIGTFAGTAARTGVTVNGTWTASVIVAGGDAGADSQFGCLDWVGNADTSIPSTPPGSGTTDDAAISGGSRTFGDFTDVTQNASIAFIVIRGSLGGSPTVAGDSHAFVAADWTNSKVTVTVGTRTYVRLTVSTVPEDWKKSITAASGTPQNLGPSTNDVFLISL